MAINEKPASKVKLAAARTRLVGWLTGSAYPLWAHNGIDPENGGFIETLAQNGAGLPHPRRARVHPRQIYAFAQAPGFGWKGDVRRILQRGTDYFTTHYLRPDGVFRTLAGVDGAPLDDRAVLYDQAFALLGYAAAAVALDARNEFERRALDLRRAIESRFRASNGAFHSGENAEGFIESNPHMHLLEACLAWAETGNDLGWTDWARHLVDLAMQKFIRHDSGALGESFTAGWQPAPGIAGRIVEPGHQFEWAWLLLRSQSRHPGPLRQAALRLIAIAEQSGVHNQVAINALLDDFCIHDPNARFWPQTERLKAALLAAQLTGEEKYWAMAAAAATSFFPYLETPVAGLWLDVQLPTGELVDSPAPASTFYHLVGAIVALDKALAGA
ncbi:MAG TPA: AGE family epimerase/isomerase [Steroidobacteraceae bacterium]|nr:AGE family epimerase/isomerase [Steroidobacteraceae bacterium]